MGLFGTGTSPTYPFDIPFDMFNTHARYIYRGHGGDVPVQNNPISSEHGIYLCYKTYLDIPTIYHVYIMYIAHKIRTQRHHLEC